MRTAAILAAITVVSSVTAASACNTPGHAACGGLPVPLAGHPSSTPAGSPPTLSSLSVPALSSRPGASAKVFLDFDGDFTPTWSSFVVGTTRPYSIDDDFSSFSTVEVGAIQEIWSAVSESYSPFEVNVTTIPPTLFEQRFVHIRVGGDGAWFSTTNPVGGLAFASSFQANFLPQGGWVFSENLLPNDPLHASFVAAASTHEAGHTFGLQHQSTFNANGELLDPYNRGDAEKAPFMGASYRKRGLWWRGPTESGPTSIQDDLARLSGSSNGFGYRADDHGNLPGDATPLLLRGGFLTGSGVIERSTDVDFFAFDAVEGLVSFQLDVAPHGAMLDASLALYNLGGDLLQMVDTPSLGEYLAMDVAGGSYRLAVLSRGGYGDIGQYSLTGALGVPIPEPGAALAAAGVGLAACRRKRQNFRREFRPC